MSTPPSYIVGIGASAGGLEALDTFFRHMPPESGLAFVVIQHLSPDYKSLMAELLSRQTRMPVQRAEDGQQVEADHVYLIPPKKNLTLFHGKLLLKEQDASRGVNLPIDVFLRSLAEDQCDRAIAIILSGTGSDGTRGIRAIKEQGGMIMVQSTDSAKFDGMPRSASHTGLPDFVLPPEEMPRLLQSFVQHPHTAKTDGPGVIVTDEDALTRIFALLRDESKVDFTFYKSSTVVRRIERRMTVNEIHELRDYARYLERNPGEVNTLYRELLIGVTSFFRDRETWDYLEESVLPEMVETAGNNGLRFWVAGCSTGEEAYSLAIITREVMDRLGITVDVKIFATDVDRTAVQNAGNGIYPESIVADLPPDLLAKYFQRQEEHFQIARRIREMVVFAPHDLLKDPPFTNINLVSCRNLLIYLQPVLQKKVLDLFNFALSPEGVLVLGNSESVGDATDGYEPVESRLRLFRTRGKRPLTDRRDPQPQDLQARMTTPLRSAPGGLRTGEEERLLGRLMDALGDDVLPLTLLVNENFELQHVIGNTEGYLGMPSGRVQNDITRLAVRDLATPLSTGLQKVFKTGEEVSYTNVHLQGRQETRTIEMRILPLPGRKGQHALAAVLLRPLETKAGITRGAIVYDLDHETRQRINNLESELQFTRENLQATVEELETSNEELQASNEELQASNEELQSTNEELQSVNEELHTVNAEYQTKNQELHELNNDLDNLLSANGVASLFLDHNLHIRRYTPALTQVCRITDADLGRHLAKVCRVLGDLDIPALAQQVQEHRDPLEREVRLPDDRWFLLTMHPYQVGTEFTSSVVMSLVDVTSLKAAQSQLARIQERNVLAQQIAHFGVFEWDLLSGHMEWSQPLESLFGLEPGQFGGTLESFLERVHPEDRPMVERTIRGCRDEGRQYDIEYRIVRTDGSVRWLSGHGKVQRDADDQPVGLTGIMRDIHERRTAQMALEASQLHFRRLFDEAPHVILLLDAEGRIREGNLTTRERLGYTQEELAALDVRELIHPDHRQDSEDMFARLLSGQPVNSVRWVLEDKSGSAVPTEVHGVPEMLGDAVCGARVVLRTLDEPSALQ
ncbi:MAG: chemotaxis protein CheB [Pseudomonadota bacterium]